MDAAEEARINRVTRTVYACAVGMAAQILLPFWSAVLWSALFVVVVNVVALVYCATTAYFRDAPEAVR